MDLMPRVVAVAPLGDYRLRLEFDDGIAGELDFAAEVPSWKGVLTSLRDPGFFAQVAVDDETGTIVWPNGVDFAPEVLHDDVAAQHTPPVLTAR